MKKIFAFFSAITLIACALFSMGCKPEEKEVNKVSVHYYNEASDILPMILSGQESIGLIPEPAVSNLEKKAEAQGKTLYRLSLQELYDSVEKSYPQAVIMVKDSLLSAYPDICQSLSTGITDTISWLKNKENVSLAVTAIKGKYEVSTLSENMSVESIENCNIYWQSATDAKTSVNKYIEKIRGIDETSANSVSDGFYYTASSKDGIFNGDSITVAMPDGAPALGLSKLIYENSDLGTGKTVNYKVVAASNIATEMATGSSDIVVIPVNAATKMYEKGTGYKLVSVLTHGNFYIVSTDKLNVNDLKDKRIAVPQRGKVPDWTLQLALKNNGFIVEEI